MNAEIARVVSWVGDTAQSRNEGHTQSTQGVLCHCLCLFPSLTMSSHECPYLFISASILHLSICPSHSPTPVLPAPICSFLLMVLPSISCLQNLGPHIWYIPVPWTRSTVGPVERGAALRCTSLRPPGDFLLVPQEDLGPRDPWPMSQTLI